MTDTRSAEIQSGNVTFTIEDGNGGNGGGGAASSVARREQPAAEAVGGVRVVDGDAAAFEVDDAALESSGKHFTFSYFEQLKVPRHLLDGSFYSALCDPYGVYPTSIIDVTKPFTIKFHWSVYGPLAKCLCGYWCINAHFESQGPGEELDFTTLYGRNHYVPYDPCGDGNYWVEVTIPPGKIDPANCSTLYRLSTSVTYHTTCRTRDGRDFQPGGMAGYADLGLIQLYESH
ncbi:MAG: hypothetical protein S0880_22170 [Actinomycetota bacterium]|nr:hypothetical protein [Actinomycetota bacterium]